MGVTSVTSATQDIWEELRQEAMRTTPKTVSPAGNQEAPLVPAEARTLEQNGTAALIERVKAQRKKKQAALGTPLADTEKTATADTVTTPLENVGPNTYERIRMNAGKTYMAQAMAAEDDAAPRRPEQERLNKSA